MLRYVSSSSFPDINYDHLPLISAYCYSFKYNVTVRDFNVNIIKCRVVNGIEMRKMLIQNITADCDKLFAEILHQCFALTV